MGGDLCPTDDVLGVITPRFSLWTRWGMLASCASVMVQNGIQSTVLDALDLQARRVAGLDARLVKVGVADVEWQGVVGADDRK